MHVPVRKADLRQRILLGDLRGQKLRQHITAGIERALHGAHDELIRYPVRQPVERQYPPRDGARAVLALKNGVCERLAQQIPARLAVKDIAFTRNKLVADVALVEECHIRAAALVHDAQLHEIEPAPDAREARLRCDHGAHARRFVQGKLGDGPHGGAVLIGAREIVEKIAERVHAETRESLCSPTPFM